MKYMSLCWGITKIPTTDPKHNKQLTVRLPLSFHAFHTYIKIQESILENQNYILWILSCLCTSFQRLFQLLATCWHHLATTTGLYKIKRRIIHSSIFFYQMLPKIKRVKARFVLVSFIFVGTLQTELILGWHYLCSTYYLWYSIMKNHIVNNESTN